MAFIVGTTVIAVEIAPAADTPAPVDTPSAYATPNQSGDAARPRHPKINKIKSLPATVKVPTYAPGPIPFRDGERLTYQASWLGIPAADAEIVLHRDPHDPGRWTAEAWINTNAAVDLVYKMRDYLREDFDRATFSPTTMYVRQHEANRRDEFTVDFDRSKQLVTMRKVSPRGVKIQQFHATNPWGMASGAAMALSQPLTDGSSLIFDVFSATSRYVLDFAVTGHEHLDTAVGPFDAVKIEPSVVWMSDKSMRDWARETIVWISADSRRLPLRIDAAIFIGTVRVDLVKVEEPGQPDLPKR